MGENPLSEAEQRQLDSQCADYLGAVPGGQRLMKALRDKYASIGRIGGSVVLKTLEKEEAEFLRSLLGRPVPMVAATIKAAELDKAFRGTRFEGVSIQGVLEAYFKVPLTTHKALRRDQKSKKARFFDEIKATIHSAPLKVFVESCTAVPESGRLRLVTLLYNSDREKLRRLLIDLDNALSLLSGRSTPVTLPVLSALATQNPHAFDEGTDLHKLLIQVLSFNSESSAAAPLNAETRSDLLYIWGIINDTGHRTVMTYGLIAYSPEGALLGWEGFAQRHEPIILSMQNMASVGSVEVLNRGTGKVFCFENPSVFQYAIAAAPDIAAVCTKGQINQSVWILLDRLTASGLTLVYSGDFDPEGLLIAQRLKRRYTSQLKWLCYDLECYREAVSDVDLEGRRLAQLSKLEDPALVRVAKEMLDLRKAGYEESILSEILKRMG